MKSKGFTIIEILMALFFLTVAGLIIGTVTFNLGKSAQHSAQLADVNDLNQKVQLLFADGDLCKQSVQKIMQFQATANLDNIQSTGLEIWDPTTTSLMLKEASSLPVTGWQLTPNSLQVNLKSKNTSCTSGAEMYLYELSYSVNKTNNPSTQKDYNVLFKIGVDPTHTNIIRCGASFDFCPNGGGTPTSPDSIGADFEVREAGIAMSFPATAYIASNHTAYMNAAPKTSDFIGSPIPLELIDKSTGEEIVSRNWITTHNPAIANVPNTYSITPTYSTPNATHNVSGIGVLSVSYRVEDIWGVSDTKEQRIVIPEEEKCNVVYIKANNVGNWYLSHDFSTLSANNGPKFELFNENAFGTGTLNNTVIANADVILVHDNATLATQRTDFTPIALQTLKDAFHNGTNFIFTADNGAYPPFANDASYTTRQVLHHITNNKILMDTVYNHPLDSIATTIGNNDGNTMTNYVPSSILLNTANSTYITFSTLGSGASSPGAIAPNGTCNSSLPFGSQGCPDGYAQCLASARKSSWTHAACYVAFKEKNAASGFVFVSGNPGLWKSIYIKNLVDKACPFLI